MIFTLIVSILNAAGWTSYYIFSGGYFEETETSAVRFSIISGFVLCSVIAGLVSFHCTHVFESILLNAGHNILTTAMASATLVLLTTDKSMFKDPNCLTGKKILLSVVLYLVAYFFYFALCIWPTYTGGEVDGLRDLMWLGGKCVIVAILIYHAAAVPTVEVGQYGFAFGLITSIPISIVLAIRSRFTD